MSIGRVFTIGSKDSKKLLSSSVGCTGGSAGVEFINFNKFSSTIRRRLAAGIVENSLAVCVLLRGTFFAAVASGVLESGGL